MKHRYYVFAAFGASLLVLGSFLLAYIARSLPSRSIPPSATTTTPPEPQEPVTISTSVTIVDVVPVSEAASQAGACITGGCSGEICGEASEVRDRASICIYRPEYACLTAHSKCERQINGTCGWTQTPELAQCTANPTILE